MTDLERLDEIRREAHDIHMENKNADVWEKAHATDMRRLARILHDTAEILGRALDGRNR